MNKKTSSGIPLKSFYGPDNAEQPGEFPFTHGVYPSMYRGRLWTMRQYAGFASAEESNKRYHYLLDQGVMGLSVAFDLPTQTGYDSDHDMAYGEVGRVGVPISSLADMEILFKNIPLEKVSVSMTINSTAAILLAMIIAMADKTGVKRPALRGTIQNDILKEYIARGTYIYPPKPSMRIVTDIFEYCGEELPNWNTISISGYHIREAGSTAVQEIAFTLANGIEYVKSAINVGLDVNSFGKRLSFFFNSHNNFFEEIAKFRTARRMWARIMKDRFGATEPKALACRFHTQTAGSTLTAQQIDNNVVRTTIQALSAVLGGTQSLHTNSRDEALSLPTDESAKLALRTQQIIAHESGVTQFADPLGGSEIIEKLTVTLEKEALSIITEIDEMGGALSAIESGWVQNEIARSAYEYQKNVDSKKQVIVGVNKFMDDTEPDFELLEISSKAEEKQITRLIAFRSSRDSSECSNALAKLRSHAKGTDNLIPSIIECVRKKCTLGEISDTLREIFGEHQI